MKKENVKEREEQKNTNKEQQEEKKKEIQEEVKVEKETKNNPKEGKKEKKKETSVTEKEKDKKEKEESKESKKTSKFKQAKEDKKTVEKEINKMQSEGKTENKKNKKRNIIITVIVIAIVAVIALIFSTIFAFLNINKEGILDGVSIQGIDVSGLSYEEAKAKLDEIYNKKMEKDINLSYEDYTATLNPTLMEVNYNIEKAVDEAYNLGRGENIFVNNYQILMTLIQKKNINIEMTLNEEVTRQSIEDIGVNLPGIVIESSYSVEDDELIITKGQPGIVIDTDKLLEQVKEILNNTDTENQNIIIPVLEKEPEAIDIDKIYEEVHTEPQDAYYTEEPFAVYPEVEGIDFDLESAREMLKEDKEEYVIPLIITKPEKTLEDIGEKAFPDELATFTTRYDASDTDRTTNLKLACEKLNGTVVLPGETFSYNDTLGPRTVAAGYKNAKIYEAGQVVDGIGGGICQISSTLYNTALKANMEIVERRNHQFVTSYVPAGRDATVVYGSTDFKFKNTRSYPIRIVASAQNGVATVTFYGIKEDTEYTFTFSTKTIATIPYSTQYIDDSSLEEGKEVVQQRGTNGLKTQTYMTKMLDGKVISTTLLSTDTYNAMARIVRRGTKKVTTNTQTQTQETKDQSNSQNKTQKNTTNSTNTTNKNSNNTQTQNKNTTNRNKTN